MKNKFSGRIAVTAQNEYDPERLALIIAEHFAALGIGASFFEGKKVVIKPNLVMKKAPEYAATTHPAVLEGLLKVLSGLGVRPLIAESPGGIYSASRLESFYHVCGLDAPAEKYGAKLNTDTSSRQMFFDGKLVRSFNIITPIADADVIIDLCKLKSHSLTTMSAAVKNLFGTIPGIEKFEAHAAYPDYKDFTSMFCDLCQMLCTEKKVIAITDAIVGMEGNGPTAGTPRDVGCIITSQNPLASDLLAEKIIGFDGKVPSVAESIRRGLCPDSVDKLEIIGNMPAPVIDFVQSDSNRGSSAGILLFFSQGKLGRIFMPRPEIKKAECRGCGECVRSCPQKTISLENNIAKINFGKCIRCYCCQELCPFGAIGIKRNLIIGTIGKIK